MARSVERLTSAQVTISQSVSSSPALGSVLTAWNLEPVSDSVSPSLSYTALLALCLSPSIKNKQTLKEKNERKKLLKGKLKEYKENEYSSKSSKTQGRLDGAVG